MGLNAILAELQPTITARVPGVTFRNGARYIDAHDPPPRVVWFPLREGFDRAPAQGRGAPRDQPRATGVRTVTVGVHVWGASYDAAEALLEAVLHAAHVSAHGSYSPGSTEWEPNGHADRGEVATLELTLSVPVLDNPPLTVVPTDATPDNTGATAGDNQLENGDA